MGKLFFLLIPLLLVFVPKAMALQSSVSVQTTGDSEVSVNQHIESSSNTSIQSTSNTGSISVHQSGGNNNVVRINNGHFTVSGKVTDKSDGHITLSGQKILIDKSKVSSFSQTGSTNNGDQVTAEGIVISGSLYAEKIYGGTPSATSNPTSTPKPTNTSNPTSLATSTPMATVAGDSTSAAEINKRVHQSIIQIIESIFTNILNSLKAAF
jgi:hypothetical protein